MADDEPAQRRTRNRDVTVEAPTTRVKTRTSQGARVQVDAPYTGVDVNTQRRGVRIDVPYFNRDIRW